MLPNVKAKTKINHRFKVGIDFKNICNTIFNYYTFLITFRSQIYLINTKFKLHFYLYIHGFYELFCLFYKNLIFKYFS